MSLLQGRQSRGYGPLALSPWTKLSTRPVPAYQPRSLLLRRARCLEPHVLGPPVRMRDRCSTGPGGSGATDDCGIRAVSEGRPSCVEGGEGAPPAGWCGRCHLADARGRVLPRRLGDRVASRLGQGGKRRCRLGGVMRLGVLFIAALAALAVPS